MRQGIGLPGSQEVLEQFPGTRSDLVGSFIEGIQLRGVFPEDVLGFSLGAVESNMFKLVR